MQFSRVALAQVAVRLISKGLMGFPFMVSYVVIGSIQALLGFAVRNFPSSLAMGTSPSSVLGQVVLSPGYSQHSS